MSVSIQIKNNEIFIEGVIDGAADFSSILEESFSGLVKIDTKAVKRVNSTGVRQWVEFIKNFDYKILHRNCSVSVIEQFNMVPQFFGKNSDIESFHAPYFCEECDEEHEILLVCEDSLNFSGREVIKDFKCPECHEELERDFDTEEFFRFFLTITNRYESI